MPTDPITVELNLTGDLEVDALIAQLLLAKAAGCAFCRGPNPRPGHDAYAGFRNGEAVVVCCAACADAIGGIRSNEPPRST